MAARPKTLPAAVSPVLVGTAAAVMDGRFSVFPALAALVCALLLLPGLLPPAWGHPKDLFTAEFRLQGIALVLGFVLILGHGLFRRVPLRGLAVSAGLLALAALVLSQSAFWAILNRLWVAYGTPTAHLGWGLWLHIVAWLGVIASAASIYVSQGE